MKKWRQNGLPPDDWGHNGNLTVAYVIECLQMFGSLNMGKYQQMTPFINSNLTVEHYLHANNVVYKTICDMLQKEANDHEGEVMYHAASIQLMEAYLWKGILAQHVLYLLGGLSIVPARFCANSEICIGTTNAHKKVKGLLPLASLNKCLHDLAKEQKVAPMVVKCINCEYYCHEDDDNLPFDAELSDIKTSLRMENKLHHMLHPDVTYYGSRMVQVSPLDHDGSRDN
jgi:hypothetical protein